MVTPRQITPAQLTGAAAAYYTSDDVQGAKSVIKKLVFTNTTGGTVNVTVYLVPKGGAPAASNTIWSARPVQAGEAKECYEAENMVLERGDTLQALGLNVSVQGTVAYITL